MSLMFSIYRALPWRIQNIACTVMGSHLYSQRYNKFFWQQLHQLNRSDYWSSEKLKALQLHRLRETVRNALSTVPYYREMLQFTMHDIEDMSFDDFTNEIPVLTKDIVREHFNSFLSETTVRRKTTRAKTSGTTGKRMMFIQDLHLQNMQWAVWWRFRGRFGLRVRDKYAAFAGRDVVPTEPLQLPAWRHKLAMNQTYFSILHLTDKLLPNIAAYLQQQKYVYISGYPSALVIVAKYLIENSIRLNFPPRYVSTGAETLSADQRMTLAEGFNANVIDQYGACDGVANISECQNGNYHVDEEFSWVEFVKDNKLGLNRIIGTQFFNSAMPLLRYDTGDHASIGSKCQCGRETQVITSIDGRIEDVIQTPDGRNVGRLDFVFKNTPAIIEAQIQQLSLHEIEVLVVGNSQYSKRDETIVARTLTKYIGEQVKIRIKRVSNIPRGPNGKLRGIVRLSK